MSQIAACYAIWLTFQHSTAQTTNDQWLYTQAHLESACYAVLLTRQYSTALARLASQMPEIAPKYLR